MANVIFVVPFALESSLRFVREAVQLEGVTLGVISQETAASVPTDIRHLLAAHYTVENALDVEMLESGVRTVAKSFDGEIDRVIGILEPLQETMAAVRGRLGIPGMSAKVAHNFRDKAQMKDLLREGGLPCARHALVNSTQASLAFARECGFPLVVKPPAGAGGKSTFRVEHMDELESYFRTVPPRPEQPVLLEEFITGKEFSFDSVNVGGEHVFHSISHYYPTPLQVMENPWIQWAVLLPRDIEGPEYEPIRSAGPRALRCLGMDTGLSHMEWFERADGSIAISEVGARPPGAQITSLLSYAHDLNFYRAWAELLVFDRFDPPERQYATGAAYLRGQGDGSVVHVHGLETAQRELGDIIVESKLPRRGQKPSSSYEGEGFVLLRHPETEVVENGLRYLVNNLRVELA